MIDQTVPLRELTSGMAECVRKSILPHLKDPSARTQAETLAALLDTLPAALSNDAHQAILQDSEAARELLKSLGEKVEHAAPADIDTAMRDNGALKARLQEIAENLRSDDSVESRQRLSKLQTHFLESMQRELEMVRRGANFAAMTSQEDAARDGGD